MTPARWRPALRMARRDLRQHKARSFLTVVLVALPVLVAVTASLFAHNTAWDGERSVRERMGAADALLEVLPYPSVRARYSEYGDVLTRPLQYTRTDAGKRRPVRRDAATVDVGALLPEGTRIVAAPRDIRIRLAGGGRAEGQVIDAGGAMLAGKVDIETGRAPTAPDEVAVPQGMAQALGMLDANGELRHDSTVELQGGTRLRVVGTLWEGLDSYLRLVVPGNTVLGAPRPSAYLVDLPDLGRPELRELGSTLAGAGVVLVPRDLVLHPEAWSRSRALPTPLNPAALAVGLLVILFGLLEVMLLVGSVFAIAARRQVRALGLLAASGGAPGDVRRVLFAQGLVLGVLASCVGAAAGVGAFLAGVPVYESVMQTRVWTRDIDWLTVVGLAGLGSVTGIAAALLPSWTIGRLTPVAALSGRFPVRQGGSTAHRPAFVLAGVGVALLASGGWWTAREFAPPPPRLGDYWQPSPIPVVVAALGLLPLLVGVVWSAPYVVRRVGELGRLLPLTGRFSFRQAMRHRFRTGAAAVALAVTVAGAVLAGFGVTSAVALQQRDQQVPPQTVAVWDAPPAQSSERYAAFARTMEDVFGPVAVYSTSRVEPVALERRGYPQTAVRRGRGNTPLEVIDEATLRYLVGPTAADSAVQALRSGAVVRTWGGDASEVTVAVWPRRQHRDLGWTVPSVRVEPDRAAVWDFSDAWISASAAADLGLEVRGAASTLVAAERPIDRADLAALAMAGFDGATDDLEAAELRWVSWAVTGGTALLALLVGGMAVALAAAESRDDAATFAAVGAGPRCRRRLGAMHGLFLGIVGVVLGLAIAAPAGVSISQVDGLAGTAVPWATLLGTVVVAPLFAAAAGWLVTPTRLSMVRRTG